ncbi:MAG: hypothetical protein H0U53_04310, partial [Actinobacteria bacterium]|nr:hypothetical protein [Actinomycetota bacterium]
MRARNEIAGVLEKASKDVDKLTKAQDRSSKSDKSRADASKVTAKAIEDATSRYNAYTAEIEKGTKSTDEAVKHLKSFQKEFDALGRRSKAGTDTADTLFKLGKSAEELARTVEKASKDQVVAEVKRTKAAQKAAADIVAARKKEAADLILETRREIDAQKQRDAAFDKSLADGEKAYRRKILAIQQGRDAVIEAKQKESQAAVAATEAERAGVEKLALERAKAAEQDAKASA